MKDPRQERRLHQPSDRRAKRDPEDPEMAPRPSLHSVSLRLHQLVEQPEPTSEPGSPNSPDPRPSQSLEVLRTPETGTIPHRTAPPSSGLPTRLYVLAIVVASLVAFLATLSPLPSPEHWILPYLLLVGLMIIIEFVSLRLPLEGYFSATQGPHIALILLIPPPIPALTILANVAFEEWQSRKSPIRALFKIGSFTLATSLVTLAIGPLGGATQILSNAANPARIALLCAIVIFGFSFLNAAFYTIVVALSTHRSLFTVIRHNWVSLITSADLAIESLGAVFAVLWVLYPVFLSLLVMPLFVVIRSLRLIERLTKETLATITRIASIVDRRDPNTFDHSSRVAVYATALAEARGLDPGEVERISRAATVHDLGKIGVPDAILFKPDSLTPEERLLMNEHTTIGGDIIAHFSLFVDGSAIVRAHHERYDGFGYPDGLAGTKIPLGARIVAVADAFDAMTSDRPYRKALSLSEAIERLTAGSGSQWDPDLVGLLLSLLSDGSIELVTRNDLPEKE